MEISGYRLLHDGVHYFKTTALFVESEIERCEIQSEATGTVVEMKGCRHQEMWVSMKTVSHFNLGTALDLMRMLLLICSNNPVPRDHGLTKVYDTLPEQYQQRLEAAYEPRRSVLPTRHKLIAFINTASPTHPPSGRQHRDTSTIRGFFEYFNEDVSLWQKRYSWELVGTGT